jgi:outer membrane protein OmpA-like peptidoglycan-associated protein
MSIRRSAILVAVAALPLAGCLTPHAKAPPSAAVIAARAKAGARPAGCRPGAPQDVSPTTATFPFDAAQLDEVGAGRLARVAAWLACNDGVQVVVSPSADNHGGAEHQAALAADRAQAVAARLRADGATAAVIRLLPPGAADAAAEPHVLILAAGRGW